MVLRKKKKKKNGGLWVLDKGMGMVKREKAVAWWWSNGGIVLVPVMGRMWWPQVSKSDRVNKMLPQNEKAKIKQTIIRHYINLSLNST